MASSDRKVILKAVFKNFASVLENNQDYRKVLEKQTNYYLSQNGEKLKDQIKLLGKDVESGFNKSWEKAAQLLADGIPQKNWNQISTLFKRASQEFTELGSRSLGLPINIGHVNSVLNLALTDKASKEIFLQGRKLRPGFELSTGYEISEQDLKDISKIFALIVSFKNTLDSLDAIQSRKELIKFLKKSKSFKDIAKGSNLLTLDDITKNIDKAFSSDTNKQISAFKELSRQIFKQQTYELKPETALNLAKSLKVSNTSIGLSIEVEALNKLKGTIAKNVKGVFLDILSEIIDDPSSDLNKDINKALETAIIKDLTKEEVLNDLVLFSTSSKNLMQAITDVVVENIKSGKGKVYSIKTLLPKENITTSLKISTPKISLDKIVEKNPGITQKVRQQKKLLEAEATKKRLNADKLLSLQSLLNTNLVRTIKQNMGNGSRRDILNLRSGRFAESVKVERLTESRQGMVTAYYNYMRNPYATFSQGGKQESPRSRDPKLLISKSIRELAAQAKITRLRAVLV